MRGANGRFTSLRELDQRLNAIAVLADERDRRYEDRFVGAQRAVDAALAAQGRLVDAAFAASSQAIAKAERAQELRDEKANEFRQTLDDQNRTFITRFASEAAIVAVKAEVMAEIRGIQGIVTALTASDNLRSGRSMGQGTVVAAIIGGLAAAGALAGVILKLLGAAQP